MNKHIFIILLFMVYSCTSKKLDQTIWKYSDGKGYISDVLIFEKGKHLEVKNDSIYKSENQSLVGIVHKVERHYDHRNLYIKDLNGNIGVYCEK